MWCQKTFPCGLPQLWKILAMKTVHDPRHKRREKITKELYEYSFGNVNNVSKKIAPIVKNLPKLDKLISQAAPEWPVNKLNKIDLAILRLAVFELTVEKKNPPKVIIDEAVELGKQYGSENSPKFINGALGSILKEQQCL